MSSCQPDGKLVVVGYPNTESTDSGLRAGALNPNGSLDSTFGIGARCAPRSAISIAVRMAPPFSPTARSSRLDFATNTLQSAEFALARYVGSSGGGGVVLTSAVSRKTHGAAGAFDIALPLSGAPGVQAAAPVAATRWSSRSAATW